MSNRTRILLAFLAVGCVIAFSLLLIFNDAVRGFILDPIVKGINAARYLLGYMPQDIQWMISLLIVFTIAIIYYVSCIPRHSIPDLVSSVPPFPNQGPAMRLAHILAKSARNRFRREQVILELRDLAAHSLAYHRGISVADARDSLDNTAWTDDPSVRDFLSLDKHRAGKQKQDSFHDQVDHALAHIEQTYQEV